MNIAAQELDPMSVTEFLDWSRHLPDGERYELIGGEAVRMQSERLSHSHAKGEAFAALREAVRKRGLPCRAIVDGPGIVCGDNDLFVPDAVLQCAPVDDPNALTLSEPIIIVEVLSAKSRGRDVGTKLEGYLSVESMAHYLVIDTDNALITHHRKSGQQAITTLYRDGIIELSPPGIELEVSDLLASVTL